MKKLGIMLAIGGLTAILGCNSNEKLVSESEPIAIPNECNEVLSLNMLRGRYNLTCKNAQEEPMYFWGYLACNGKEFRYPIMKLIWEKHELIRYQDIESAEQSKD